MSSENTLAVIDQLGGPDSNIAKNRAIVAKIVREVNERGYAAAVGLEDPKISAIALPVRAPNSVIGAVNIIFFRSAMTAAQAAERYLSKLRVCVDQIVHDISDKPLTEPAAASRKRSQ